MKTLREMMDLIESAQNGDYEYPYDMSARDKGRYDAMQGREYRNPYSAFGTEEDNNNSIEYSAAYDAAKEEGVNESDIPTWKTLGKDETDLPLYTVAVDCGEDGTYTVKVHASDKFGALATASKIVRRQYDTYPESARIVSQGVDEEQLKETEADPVRRIEELFRDK